MAPYVIINCAMSADGKIALPSRKQTRISNEEDMRRVHELRHASDAVLVGIGTVLSDDPKLTVKDKYVPNPRQPLRIVLDSRGRTPVGSEVLSDAAPTLIIVTEQCSNHFPNAEVITCGKDKVDLHMLMERQDSRGIKKLLVEGGESVIWSFLKERLADELYIFMGTMVIGGESSPTPAGGEGAQSEEEIISMILKDVNRFGEGVLLHYDVKK